MKLQPSHRPSFGNVDRSYSQVSDKSCPYMSMPPVITTASRPPRKAPEAMVCMYLGGGSHVMAFGNGR
eukprot:3932774-Rhodomonas_salina.1